MNILPIIRITEFLQGTLEGGTTRPMLVLGEDGKKYVLKVFSIKDASQRSYTVAEVIANLLAKEFDLNVPEAVYMTIDKALLELIKETQPETHKILNEKSIDRIMFGSLYYEGYPIYSSTNKDKLLALDEFESILAFDILISNSDRRAVKPNILRGQDHYLLIDHEKAFEGMHNVFDNIQIGVLPYYFEKHLFYKKLNKVAKKSPNTVKFETFEEYFRILRLDKIKDNVDFMIQKGYDKEECLDWIDSLEKLKKNYLTFVTLLKTKINE